MNHWNFDANPEWLEVICCFVDTDFVVTELEKIDFERGAWNTHRTLVMWVEENFMLSLFAFLVTKKKNLAFKSSLNLYFSALIIELFWFAQWRFKN